MRASNSRRCTSSVMPMKQMTPATPPTPIAIHCLKVCEMPSASKTQIGVSRPTKWPRKMTRMPTWNRLEPHVSCRRRSKLARSAAPGVLLAVEAQHAAEQEHGQAEIGIPAEDDVVDQFAHDRFLIGAADGAGRGRHVRRGTQAAADTGDQPVLAAVAGAGTEA